MSRPSVESTLFRARRRLTEEYDELVSGARCQRIQAIIADATATTPGARDQRRLARHISHCQPCRRQARLAGLDIPVTADRPMRQRIAAILPLPLFLRKWLNADGSDVSAAGSSHATNVAQWTTQFGSFMDPSWVKAAAAAATVAVAGAGAGFAGQANTPTSPAGNLGQLVTGLETTDDDVDAGSSATAASVSGTRTVPGLTTALTAANALAGALPAASATAQPTATKTAAGATSTTESASSGSGGGSTNASAANPASALPDPATAAQDATQKVQASVQGGSGGGNGSSPSGGNTGPASSGSAPSIPTHVDASVPSSTGISAPDPAAATQAAGSATQSAGDAVSGATGAAGDAVGGATGGTGSLVGGG